MTIAIITERKSKILGRVAQLLSGVVAITIISLTAVYAYGYNPTLIEQFFSFSVVDLLIKVMLGITMLVLVFFSRPRSTYLRIMLGTFASVALVYTNFGAFTETLALGDGIVYFIGSLIAMTETVEAELPDRSRLPSSVARHSSSVKIHPA